MFIVDPPTANGPRDHTGDYGVLQIWGERRQSYIQKTAFSGKFRTNSPSPTKAAFKY
jgi:hypothetical protein